jgi:DNA gyrase subunit A
VAERAEKEKLIHHLQKILASPHELDQLIVEELEDLKTRFGDARRTKLVPAFTARTLEDLIPDTDVVVLVTRDGYIKRLPLDQYRRQRRGGKGLIQMETKEEDYVIRTFLTRTHDNVLFFTTLGRVYRLKAYELPEGSRHSKGKAVINLLPKLKPGEKVQTLLAIRDLESEGALFFASRKGIVKRTTLDQFQNIRTNGIQAVLLEEGDSLVDVALVKDERTEIVLATRAGQLVRFPLGEVRTMGRATYGVFGVRLGDEADDAVVAMAPVSHEFPSLLTLTSTGFGKRSPVEDYRRTKRGAKGVRTIRTGGRNGSVVAVLPVRDDSELLVTTQNGITIRLSVASIRDQGRNTMGVRIIRIEEGDQVRDAVVLASTLEVASGGVVEAPVGPAAPDSGDPAEDAAPAAAPPDDDDEEQGDDGSAPTEG